MDENEIDTSTSCPCDMCSPSADSSRPDHQKTLVRGVRWPKKSTLKSAELITPIYSRHATRTLSSIFVPRDALPRGGSFRGASPLSYFRPSSRRALYLIARHEVFLVKCRARLIWFYVTHSSSSFEEVTPICFVLTCYPRVTNLSIQSS